MNAKRINWNNVDWSKPDRTLSVDLGVTTTAVLCRRQRLDPEWYATREDALESLGKEFRFYFEAMESGTLNEVVRDDMPRVRAAFPHCADEFFTNTANFERSLNTDLKRRQRKLASRQFKKQKISLNSEK